MDLEEMGIVEDRNKIGCPQYDPRAMLKLWTYGCSYGFRSSRKLEREDEGEAGEGSLVHLREELKDREQLKDRIQGVPGRLKKEGRTSLNTTDEDCVRVRSPQGSHAGYTGHMVADDEHDRTTDIGRKWWIVAGDTTG